MGGAGAVWGLDCSDVHDLLYRYRFADHECAAPMEPDEEVQDADQPCCMMPSARTMEQDGAGDVVSTKECGCQSLEAERTEGPGLDM